MTIKKSEIIDILGRYNIPGSICYFIMSYAIAGKRNEFFEKMLNSPGEVFCTWNDVGLIYHKSHPKFEGKEIVEIYNPYAEYEFAFLSLDDFVKILNFVGLLSESPNVTCLPSKPSFRSDYNENKDEWQLGKPPSWAFPEDQGG